MHLGDIELDPGDEGIATIKFDGRGTPVGNDLVSFTLHREERQEFANRGGIHKLDSGLADLRFTDAAGARTFQARSVGTATPREYADPRRARDLLAACLVPTPADPRTGRPGA